jgi:hypothetical protein
MRRITNADLPTPPEPKTTSLYSLIITAAKKFSREKVKKR